MNEDLSVAVIVTCYNQERYIEQALDSLRLQTVRPAQIIVIDGFSKDRSVRVIEDWMSEHPDVPITFIAHDQNYGLNATLNQGMDLVTSRFVVTLYGDDWLEPDRIAHQAPLLAAAADDVCMVVGSMREVDKRGNSILDHDFGPRIVPLTTMTPDERLAALVRQNVIPSPAVMLKAALVREVGGYDERLTFDDYDMWLRLLSRYTLLFDPKIVVNYRILANSLSRNVDRHGDFLLSEAKMVHKYAGRSAELDALIEQRIRRNTRTLIEFGDLARCDVALELLGDVSVDSGYATARAALAEPGAIERLQQTGYLADVDS